MRLSIETGSKLGQSSALLKRTTLPTLQLCSADGALRRGRTGCRKGVVSFSGVVEFGSVKIFQQPLLC